MCQEILLYALVNADAYADVRVVVKQPFGTERLYQAGKTKGNPVTYYLNSPNGIGECGSGQDSCGSNGLCSGLKKFIEGKNEQQAFVRGQHPKYLDQQPFFVTAQSNKSGYIIRGLR
ncbi:hypothetical protein GCM10028819_31350 [Spirosoma humi]